MDKDYALVEWIGFNYRKFTKDIDNVIKKDEFTNLRAVTNEELTVGYLGITQIDRLKGALKETFNKGLSIRTLASTLVTQNIIPPLYGFDEEGNKFLRLSQETRSLIVARTETIRMSGLGAIENYKENGIEKLRWTAAISERTCPICIDLNGRVFEIVNFLSEVEYPAHVNCRCALSPVVLE